MKHQSEGRYKAVRNAKVRERNDESQLSFTMRLMRRTIQNSKLLTVIQWNWETEQDGRPLWFDAAVAIKLPRGRKELGLIDLENDYEDPRNKALKARKEKYSLESQTSYLRVRPHHMEAAIFAWALDIRAKAECGTRP